MQIGWISQEVHTISKILSYQYRCSPDPLGTRLLDPFIAFKIGSIYNNKNARLLRAAFLEPLKKNTPLVLWRFILTDEIDIPGKPEQQAEPAIT